MRSPRRRDRERAEARAAPRATRPRRGAVLVPPRAESQSANRSTPGPVRGLGLVGRAPRRARPARPPPPSAPTRRAAGARWGAGAPVGGPRARRWWLVRGAVGPRVMVNGFVTRVTKALPLPGSGLDRPYVLTRRVAARPVRRSRSRRAARAAPFTVNANTWCDTLVRPSVPVGARVACDAACVRGSRSFRVYWIMYWT